MNKPAGEGLPTWSGKQVSEMNLTEVIAFITARFNCVPMETKACFETQWNKVYLRTSTFTMFIADNMYRIKADHTETLSAIRDLEIEIANLKETLHNE